MTQLSSWGIYQNQHVVSVQLLGPSIEFRRAKVSSSQRVRVREAL
jgi:hypothetical protein